MNNNLKFKLPRKKKKKFKKDCYPHFKSYYNKECWEWFYFKRRVEVRNMEVIINYPDIISNTELLSWYEENCPNDKLAKMFCLQNRHKWDKFNKKWKQ